jgi:hypothetical protein
LDKTNFVSVGPSVCSVRPEKSGEHGKQLPERFPPPTIDAESPNALNAIVEDASLGVSTRQKNTDVEVVSDVVSESESEEEKSSDEVSDPIAIKQSADSSICKSFVAAMRKAVPRPPRRRGKKSRVNHQPCLPVVPENSVEKGDGVVSSARPPFLFSGTLRRCLNEPLSGHHVVIYGGYRSTRLVSEMTKLNFASVQRQPWENRLSPLILPERDGKPIAIFDVKDNVAPREIKISFQAANSQLTQGDLLVLLAERARYVRVWIMLCQQNSWNLIIGKVSPRGDYFVAVLKKVGC